MCREYDTQCVCQGQLKVIFKNLFGMITETFSPKHSNSICSVTVPNFMELNMLYCIWE
jgi:hypothetical protein